MKGFMILLGLILVTSTTAFMFGDLGLSEDKKGELVVLLTLFLLGVLASCAAVVIKNETITKALDP